MAEREYTDAEIQRAILVAVSRNDMQVVPGLITLLALQNPSRAETVRQTMLLGLELTSTPWTRHPLGMWPDQPATQNGENTHE